MTKHVLFFVLISIGIFLFGCATTEEDKPKLIQDDDSSLKVFTGRATIEESKLKWIQNFKSSFEILIEVLVRIKTDHMEAPKMKELAFNAVKGMEKEVARREYNISKLELDWESAENEYESTVLLEKAYKYFIKNTGIPPKELVYSSIKSVLKGLDSSLITYKEERQAKTKEGFARVGIEFTLKNGFLIVISSIEKSPAFKAGIKKGDKVLRIENETIKNLSFSVIKRLLRGPKGSTVTILVKRKGFDKPIFYEIERNFVKSQNIKHKFLEAGLGYVKINQFLVRTPRNLKKTLNALNAKAGGLKGLILDLRNNNGGVLQSAVNVADTFLESGLIVFTKGRYQHQEMSFEAKASGAHLNYPVVILVNKETAGGSEIVAGALQYWKRAIILGTLTSGSGSIRTLRLLSDDSGVSLKTAMFFTPDGRSIQNIGITPNIMVKLEYPENFGDFKFDVQLQQAVITLKDRLK